jgi:hypothetical protein
LNVKGGDSYELIVTKVMGRVCGACLKKLVFYMFTGIKEDHRNLLAEPVSDRIYGLEHIEYTYHILWTSPVKIIMIIIIQLNSILINLRANSTAQGPITK